MTSLEAITFTDKYYLEYTLNLLASIDKNKSEIQLCIYCSDEESFDYLKKGGHKALLIENKNFNNYKLQSWSAGKNDFGKTMINKFKSIYDALNKSDLVLYLDGDIVVKKNFTRLLLDKVQNNDFLFQLDFNPKKAIQEDLCAGFMLIKSNKNTIEIFNPNETKVEEIIKLPSHDQSYLNLNKNNFQYKFLSSYHYPNGAYYLNYVTDPYIIHFNYLVGNSKKKFMKRYGEWYLEK